MKKEARTLPASGEGPLYKQLSDMLSEEIMRGQLIAGNNLPTVRDLSQEMKLSIGTVKHAYDELERLGVIEKIRGRGTFVKHLNEPKHGKKDRALRLVDDLFRDMLSMGFSLMEIQIFFDLKLRSLEDNPKKARVVVVDCNPEALCAIANQIAQIRGAEVDSMLLKDLSHSPLLIDDNSDIIVTTANHYDVVSQATNRREYVCKVALSPSKSTIASLAKTGNNAKFGIISASNRFAGIIGNTCADLAQGISQAAHMLFGDDGIESFLESIDILVLPELFSRFCTSSEIAAIRAFSGSGGKVIEFTYHIDAGSLMYLKQRIEAVLK